MFLLLNTLNTIPEMLYFSADEPRSLQIHTGPNIISWHKILKLFKSYKICLSGKML